MWVCEPQGVSTAAMYLGFVGSLMSKTFRPSHELFSVAGCGTLAQLLSERLESVESTSRLRYTDTSFCEPGQTTWEIGSGLLGLPRS